MTLADAIRKGAMQREQAFFYTLSSTEGSCALGAAYEAVFGTAEASGVKVYSELNDLYGLYGREHLCPDCSEFQSDECDIIIHLNDCHKWTREAIADWLDTLEDRALRIKREAGLIHAPATPEASEGAP